MPSFIVNYVGNIVYQMLHSGPVHYHALLHPLRLFTACTIAYKKCRYKLAKLVKQCTV